MDSGASKHMTPLKDGLENLHASKGKVLIGDKTSILVHGIGNLQVIPNGKGGMFTSKVLYVPDLGYHLLSVKELCKLGLLIEFSEDHVWIRDLQSRTLVSEGYEEHGVYKLKESTALTHYLPSSTISSL